MTFVCARDDNNNDIIGRVQSERIFAAISQHQRNRHQQKMYFLEM